MTAPLKYERITSDPDNPFEKLVKDQIIAIIPEFELETGEILHDVKLAYKTWGKLNEDGDNAMVICHALTGSSDISDWWGPLMGPGRAFDEQQFFVIGMNALGSPYGSSAPCTINPDTGEYYGPEFPLTTIKDDARLQKLLLDDLGVKQVAAVVGGSMGGMLVLEYAYFGKDFVRTIIPIATCATLSAWAISWGEAQRQSIYSDPKYEDGYYKFSEPPVVGLAAARMSALLTYRTRNSFESKFGRSLPDPLKHKVSPTSNNSLTAAARTPTTPQERRWALHNHGHIKGKKLSSGSMELPSSSSTSSLDSLSSTSTRNSPPPQTYFTAQSYLRYQGTKFVDRFDANCYISITRKLDTHDVARGRADSVPEALAMISQPTLVIGISSDGLFTFTEQEKLAQHIPHSTLHQINSPEGHDAFLLEFVEMNQLIISFLRQNVRDIYDKSGIEWNKKDAGTIGQSVFGEAEAADVDVTHW